MFGTICRSFSEVRRWAVLIACGSIISVAAGCGLMGGDEAERTLRENIKLGGGPEAMWYHFTFTAKYRGEPFRLSQWVHCGWRTIAGGLFGSAPAITTRAMYPRQIGRRMPDGSYIVVRVPEMCHHHRNFFDGGEFRPGWQSRGPFSVLPLVTWNDRRPNTRVVEQYVGRGYYRDPRARVTDPRGRIDLMPVGFHPEDYETALKTPEWAASDPDENIDPKTGKRWANLYAYGGDGLLSLYTVPTVDMAAALRRFEEPAEALLREFESNIEFVGGGLRLMEGYLRAGREELPGYKGDRVKLPLSKGVQDERFKLYDDSSRYDVEPFRFDPTYLPPSLIGSCIGSLRAGMPIFSNLPVDPYPLWGVRSENAVKAQRDRRRLLAACVLLDRLVSFDVRDGRLDASGALPGVIVLRKWGRSGPSKSWPLPDSGVAYSRKPDGWPSVLKFRFGKATADLDLPAKSHILEDRATNQWYALFLDGYRLTVDSYAEGGW